MEINAWVGVGGSPRKFKFYVQKNDWEDLSEEEKMKFVWENAIEKVEIGFEEPKCLETQVEQKTLS